MSNINFGPGFAQPSSTDGGGGNSSISLRDQIAIAAMASLTALYWEDVDAYESASELLKCQTEAAYEMADAMLEARSK